MSYSKIAIDKVAPDKLIRKTRETENGKLAYKLGELAYNSFQDKEYLKIRGDEKEIRTILYDAQAALEQIAMREILNQYFS